jgi:hypothetical protein
VKIFAAVNNLASALVSLAILAALGFAGWYVVRTYLGEKWEREAIQAKLADRELKVQTLSHELDASKAEISSLNQDLEAKRQEIQRLATALRLLKVDHRVAQIDVLSQQGSEKTKDLMTKFSFTELDSSGKPIETPRVFVIKGDVAYVDAFVVKFSDESVEVGDPLRSTSLCLFRRVFGELQRPKDGFDLDRVGAQPTVYRTGREPSEFEREIWSRFWDYANNPEEAQKKGIRAAHGEAPSQQLRPGKRYKVLLRSSSGLTFVPEDIPAKPADKTL